jgi:hypothetical protein
MATKLTKPVVRETEVEDINGCKGDVCVTVSASGIAFHKGKRKLPVIPWSEITKLATLPPNIPAKFSGNKIGWLVELSAGKDDKPETTPTPTTAPPDATTETSNATAEPATTE